jgi:hypothetical protein
MDGLRQLTRYSLDADIDAITQGDLSARTFGLVAWAEEHGRLSDLMAGAVRANPNNAEMAALVGGAFGALYDGKKTVFLVQTWPRHRRLSVSAAA